MKIFVGGSLRDVPVNGEFCKQFVDRLGEKIVEREHILLNGCSGSLDAAIVRAAADWIGRNSNVQEIRRRIIGYKLRANIPVVNIGLIRISKRNDWSLETPDLSVPEQISEADVTVFIAGSEGTYFAANWARIADKPVLGVAQFGGAGEAIFQREREQFTRRYSHLASIEDFDMLNQYTDDVEQLAHDVVALCEKLMTSRTVFTIMSFKTEFDDLYQTYKRVLSNEEFGFEAIRTDKDTSMERIMPRILDGIKHSAFVIADVTEKSLNVFYEIGYAAGLGRPVVITAKKGTEIPFDIKDHPIVFWSTLTELEGELGRVLRKLKQELGKG